MSCRLSESTPARRAEVLIDVLFLAILALFFLHYLPLDLLRSGPATGGDLGSHFWPVKTLVEYGIPNSDFPVWNPANNGGEAQLLHYFPLPFFLIVGLSFFLPLGMAFNFGVLLPLLLLPFAAYLCARCMGFLFPGPLLAACAAQTFTLNESYKIWGGNALSTLAGQFAHQYAFLFFTLGIGALCCELRSRRKPCSSALFFAAVVCSHPYVALALPVVAGCIILFFPSRTLRERFRHVFGTASWSLLLSLWFLIPLLDNQQWTTPLSMVWERSGLWAKILPALFLPWIVLGVVSLSVLLLFHQTRKRIPLLRAVALWTLAVAVSYGIGFYVFPEFGLVDVRALPQIQYCLLLLSALAIGEALALLKIRHRYLCASALSVASIIWLSGFIVNLSSWSAWNFSGWESKKGYKHLEKFYAEMKGDFNDPRIVYEHSPLNHFAGSVRVFEMLPYFTGRATLESVYTQSTILARSIYLLQSEISKSPSCPFSLSPCHKRDVGKAIEKMSLLGVGSFVAVEPTTVAEAMKIPELRLRGRYGPWRVFDLRAPSSYVGHTRVEPRIVEGDNWRGLFDTWFQYYPENQEFLIAGKTLSAAIRKSLSQTDNSPLLAPPECEARVSVSFEGLILKTPCPGYLHYLAFAYHPTWKADTEDDIFAVSPGFIGIIPSKGTVMLRFGESRLWQAAHRISLLSLLVLLSLGMWRLFKVERPPA